MTVADIAASLPPFLRQMVLGDYDPEFASTSDASELIRLGLWSWDPDKPIDPDSEYYELDITDLGLAVRAHLLETKDG